MSYAELLDGVQAGPRTYYKGEVVTHIFVDGSAHELQIDKIFELDGEPWIQYHYLESHIKTSGDGGSDKLIVSPYIFSEIFKLT